MWEEPEHSNASAKNVQIILKRDNDRKRGEREWKIIERWKQTKNTIQTRDARHRKKYMKHVWLFFSPQGTRGLSRAVPRSFVEFSSNSSNVRFILEKGAASPTCPARICPSVKHMPVGCDMFANGVQFSVDIYRVSVPRHSPHVCVSNRIPSPDPFASRMRRGMIILRGGTVP